MAANLVPEISRARVVFQQGRGHLQIGPPNLLLTTLKVAAAIAVVAIAERSTNFTDYNAPKRPVEFQPPNTLLTLLAPKVAAPVVVVPFNQKDWPNPVRPWQRDLTWTQSLEVIPPRVIPVPFNQKDWPNPLRSPIRDLTWTNTPKVIPQVPDIAVASRIPNQTDWPNPQRPPIRDLTWTQTPQVISQVAVIAARVPFEQADWPNPLRSPVLDLTWTQTPQAIPPVVIPPVVAPPFVQTDWPNPIGPWVRDLTWTQSPKVQEIVPAPVVAIAERPTTFTEYFPKLLPVWFDPPNLQLTLLPPPVVIPAGTEKPFSQTDWQNPVLRTPFLESGWIDFANIGDIPARPTPVVAPPFIQTDWPNPVLRTVRIKTPESYRPAPDTIVAVVSTPFSQEDWPNPVRRIGQREFGFTRFANIGDIPPVVVPPAPFDQTDWPNPLRPWVRDLTWLQSPKVQEIPAPIIPPTPFVQTDWQNPLKPWQRDLNWSQSPQVQQIVPEPAGTEKPFSQTDWQNPVLRTPFKESGWVRFANIGDIPAATPVIPVPPAPTEEVKPSGGRVDHEFKYAIEGRRTYVQKLRDWRIAQEAAEVIEQVALQQAATLEINEAKNARALKRALRLAKVQDDARYLALLAERR